MKQQIKRWLSLALVIATLFTFTACDLDTDYEVQRGESSTYFAFASSDAEQSAQSEQATAPSQSSSSASTVGGSKAEALKVTEIPAYSGKAWVEINGNTPNFSADELTTKAYEHYSGLDSLGRCGVATATCGTEIMPAPNEKRGSISTVKPTGWVQAKYSGISGGYLWNRCHLIGWQLSAENANKCNLITGTRYMNVEGMLIFENQVADYIKETENHVAYRITPIFEGNNLVCSGVQMEAYSIEDEGEGVCFNVYCYNIQPGITINYATGESSGKATVSSTAVVSKAESVYAPPVSEQTDNSQMVYVSRTGTKFHSNSRCSNMKNPLYMTREEAESRGRTPCSKCY